MHERLQSEQENASKGETKTRSNGRTIATKSCSTTGEWHNGASRGAGPGGVGRGSRVAAQTTAEKAAANLDGEQALVDSASTSDLDREITS